jgi:C4-dicarboxylate-specific signal transduction histidine kinase
LIALLAVATVILLWLPLGLSANSLAVTLFLLIAVDIAAVLLFGDYLIRHLVLRPVDRMLGASERIAAGDDGVRLEVGGADEVRRLSESVNRMADKLIRNQGLLADNIRSLDDTNRQLMEARAKLIHVEKMASVGRLAAGIAHEIGNPLGAILGYVDVAKSRESGAEWIDGVKGEARRIDRIVRGLLDYARPKAAAVKPVAVNDIVRQALDLVETQGRLKGVSLKTDLADDVPEVLADRFQLEQVLVNLLLNATDSIAEASADGAITVRTLQALHHSRDPSPRPRRKDDPEGVDYSHLRRMREPPAAFQPSPLEEGALIARIDISDNGSGLQPGEAERIFDPFYTTKAPGQGTGLGLAVSARLIDGMRGQVRAEDNPDGGAVFSISLPAIDGDEVMERQESEEASG